jgi:uncharacterized protein YegJ (DUF2314 family)
MIPAIAQARETLPQFWAKVDAPKSGISEAAIKVGFPTQHGGVEFLWLEVERHGSAAVFGRILNEPEDAPSVHAGQEISVPNTRIIDWTYNKGGKYFGQFTTRVLLKTADEATRRQENLAPTPVEPKSH